MKAPRSAIDGWIAGLYRAGAGACTWSEALSFAKDELGLLGAQMVGLNLSKGSIVLSHASLMTPPEAELEYIREYHSVDPRIPWLLGGNIGQWFYCEDKFAPGEAEAHPYYRDLLIPYGGRHSALAKLHHDEEEAVMIGYLSRLGGTGFGAELRAVLEEIGYHLCEALPIYMRSRSLARQSTFGHQVVARLSSPAINIAPDRSVAFANAAGERLLRTGLPFLLANEKLHAKDAAADQELKQVMTELIAEAAASGAPPRRRVLRLPRDTRSPAVAASLTAFSPGASLRAFGESTQVMVIIHERRAPTDPDLALWQAAYEFTPAQARVAREIYLGKSLKEAASTLVISEGTAKSHLEQAFHKAGVERQSALVTLLAGLQ